MERALERAGERETVLQEQMATAATDHARLAELDGELRELRAERDRLETEWLELSEALEA